MKSKFIFIMLLLSLLLNICHDLLIEQQIEIKSTIDFHPKNTPTMVSKHQILDVHEIFHFHALILKPEQITVFPKISKKMFFAEISPPQCILESSFKPPRV